MDLYERQHDQLQQRPRAGFRALLLLEQRLQLGTVPDAEFRRQVRNCRRLAAQHPRGACRSDRCRAVQRAEPLHEPRSAFRFRGDLQPEAGAGLRQRLDLCERGRQPAFGIADPEAQRQRGRCFGDFLLRAEAYGSPLEQGCAELAADRPDHPSGGGFPQLCRGGQRGLRSQWKGSGRGCRNGRPSMR